MNIRSFDPLYIQISIQIDKSDILVFHIQTPFFPDEF